ncbi:probable selenocysteine insertion sequence-binding protein 2-like at C-terminar half [Coccomyxa sp. Obi]|nr:probable selenocysteine insertion sequence-binding protein 2-like at C-terminar half [Coccomyxa sp. Obi]
MSGNGYMCGVVIRSKFAFTALPQSAGGEVRGLSTLDLQLLSARRLVLLAMHAYLLGSILGTQGWHKDEREQTMSAPEGILPPGSAWLPATPEAWGGAARLRTPAPSLRDAMEQQLHANTPTSFQQLQQQLEGMGDLRSPFPGLRDAQGWMQEALKSRRDALTGQLRCQLCAKVMPDYNILAQHLKDKHGGQASEQSDARTPEQSLTISLAELLRTQRSGAARTPSSAPPQLTAKQLRSVKGLVQAYPTKGELAEAFKGRLFATGKKKMSRLKRIILRERANKAFADASASLESAAAAARLAAALRNNIREQLRVAGEALVLQHRGGTMPDASAITQLQVLEVAAVEAERRVIDAERKVKDAEVELEKAAAEQARFINELVGPEDDQQPESSQAAAVAVDGAGPSGSGSTPEQATLSSPAAESQEPPTRTEVEGAVEQSEAIQSHAMRVAFDLGIQSRDGAESVDGLDDFEDVLATWLHAAHARAVSAYPDSTIWSEPSAERAAPSAAQNAAAAVTGTQSEPVALIEAPERQQQQPIADAAEGPSLVDATEAAGPQSCAASAALAECSDVGKSSAAVEEEEDGDDDADLGPDDWDDILSAWMSAVGLTDMLKASEQTERGPKSFYAPACQPAGEATATAAAMDMSQDRTSQPLSSALGKVSAPAQEHDQQQQPQRQWEQGSAMALLMGPGNPAGGQRNGASRSFLAVVPQMDQATADTLPLLGHESPLSGAQTAPEAAGGQQSDMRRGPHAPRVMLGIPAWLDAADSDDGFDDSEASGPSGASPPEGDGAASMSAAAKNQSSATMGPSDRPLPMPIDLSAQASVGEQGAPSELRASAAAAPKQVGHPVDPMRMAPPPPGSTPMVVSTLEALWHSKLQGQSYSVEEMIEKGMLSMGNDSPASSSPAYSRSPRRLPDIGSQQRTAAAASQMQEDLQMPTSVGATAAQMPSSAPQQTDQDRLLQGLQGSATVDAARQRALESILQKHSAPLQASAAGGFPLLGQPLQPHLMQSGYPDSQLKRINSSGLLQAYQQAQRGQLQQQALQGSFRSLSSTDPGSLPQDHYSVLGHSAAGDLPTMGGSFPAMQFLNQQLPKQRRGLVPGMMQEEGEQQSSFGSHEFYCEVCGITCCGLVNFEQHCSSKKHLRRAAAAAGALAGGGMASDSTDNERNTTYVGLQAQCRNYCKQVISTELNRAVVELLQQLLFWQERAKATSPYNVTKRKRLVSGLREVAKAVRLRKACTVVVAPNIEQIESEGGLDDLLSSILTQAEDANIPIIFALSRKKLGQMFGCRKKMSAIAILDYSGAEAIYHHMEALAQQGRAAWLSHNTGADASSAGPSSLPNMGSGLLSLSSDLSSQQQGGGSEEGGLYNARSQDFASGEFGRGKGLPGAQLSAAAAPTDGAGPSGHQHPGPVHRHRGGAATLPHLGARLQPTQQPAINAAQRQAQQRHFQHIGRLASMQSAQELLDSQMVGLYDQQALAQQLSAGLHFDGGAGGGFGALDAAGLPGLGLDYGQHAGAGLAPLGPMAGFQAQGHGMEGAAYGGALYGQPGYGAGGATQQLPYGVEDPRVGGHYMSQWQNPGAPPQGGGGAGAHGGGSWFS